MDYVPSEMEILRLTPESTMLSGWEVDGCSWEGGGVVPCDENDGGDWGGKYFPAKLEIVKLDSVDVLAVSGDTCEIVFCLLEAGDCGAIEIN